MPCASNHLVVQILLGMFTFPSILVVTRSLTGFARYCPFQTLIYNIIWWNFYKFWSFTEFTGFSTNITTRSLYIQRIFTAICLLLSFATSISVFFFNINNSSSLNFSKFILSLCIYLVRSYHSIICII